MTQQPTIAPYLRAHLAGAAAGITLFGRSRQPDPVTREAVASIHSELLEEQAFLRQLADALDVREFRATGLVATAAIGLARLTFRGPGLRGADLADLAELETMHDAVSGKLAGWRALRCIADQLPCERGELDALITRAERQRDDLMDAHARASVRDLRAAPATDDDTTQGENR